MAHAATDQLKVTTHPAERSSVVLEVELPAERVQRSVEQSVRHLARRTRVPGFRPGKVPRPLLERALGVRRDDPDAPNPLYDDAKEHLFEQTVIQAVQQEDLDVLSIPEPEWLSFEEDNGAAYRVTLPLRPEVKLGAYRDYPFKIEVEEITPDASTRSSTSCATSRPTWCRSRIAARRRRTMPSSASRVGAMASPSRARSPSACHWSSVVSG
jgi:FKBP-type peptidyl-prolyl cis-trans isomerase (trigger factor)